MIQLIYGKNAFMRQQYVQDAVDKFISSGGSHDEVYKVRVETDTNCDEILLQMQNVSLFAEKKLTILYDFTASHEVLEKIEQFCESADESNWLILIDSTLQARSKIVSGIEKRENASVKKAADIKGRELAVWAVKYVEKLRPSVVLSRQNAEYLVERLGEDQLLLASELEKLVSGVDSTGEITEDYITDVVELTPQGSVFAMLDAMLAGKANRAMAIYQEQIAQGAVAQQIIGMIVWQITQLAIVVDAQHLSNKELTDTYGVSSFALSKLRPIAKRLHKNDVAEIVSELVDADYQSRTNASADDAVEYIVSFITTYLNKKQRP